MNYTPQNNNSNNAADDVISDILDVISIALNLKNLSLNEQQVRDLNNHLKMQDEQLLQKIIDQNEVIIDLNKKILKLIEDNHEYHSTKSL